MQMELELVNIWDESFSKSSEISDLLRFVVGGRPNVGDSEKLQSLLDDYNRSIKKAIDILKDHGL